MAEGYPVALQNGIPEARIVQSQFGRRGYLVRPHLGVIPTTISLPSNIGPQPTAVLPFAGGSLIKRGTLGFSALFHAHANSEVPASPHVETAVFYLDQDGIMRDGRFTADAHATGDPFLHHYTDPDTMQPATRILTFGTNGAIVDFETGDTLSTSGATGISGAYTHVVNDDGTHAVLNAVNTSNELQATNRRNYVIDFAADPQVTITTISESSDHGSYTESMVNGVTTVEGEATYRVNCGIGEAGAFSTNVVTATYDGTHTQEISVTGTVGGPFDASHTFSAIGNHTTRTGEVRPDVVLELPNGTFAFLSLSEINEEGSGQFSVSELNGPVTSFSASYTRTSREGSVRILYSDPSVPVLVYEYNYLDTVIPNGTAIVIDEVTTGPENNASVGISTTITRTRKREVGILIGETHRTLFTDSSPALQEPLIQAVVSGSGIEVSTPTGPTSSTTNLTTNPYRKPLRYVTPIALLTAPVTDNRYQIVVVDADHWIVAVTKLRTLAVSGLGSVASSFDIYAGGMDEDAAEEALKAHLIARYNIDPPDFPEVLEDLLADEWDNYEVRLDSQTQPGAI